MALRSLVSFLSLATASKPHILWIVSDDLGWDDLGFRSGQIHTPVLDSFAKDGMVLANYYVQPSCSPSRATFMSGRFPLHHGVNTYIDPKWSYGLPLNETTVAQLLQRQGYRTHAIGKWHIGSMAYAYTPTFRGFESFYGFYGGGEDYFTHMAGGALDFRRDSRQNCGKGCSHQAVEDVGSYSTQLFSDEAIRIINAHNASEPLFLYLAYQAVHAKDQVPQSYIDAYSGSIKDRQRLTFAAMLTCMDEGIGNVTAALRSKGMLEDTFLIFTTDNGGPSETCAVTGTSNYPHRGSKCSLWEGGTKGTALVHGRGLTRAGVEFGGLMHGADWLPTLLDMVGAPVQAGQTLPLDGISLWPELRAGAGAGRSDLYYGVTDLQVGNHGPALQAGNMKLIIGGTGGLPGQWPKPAESVGPVGAAWSPPLPNRTFPPLDNVTYLLFNLSVDEDEHVDIAGQYPDIVSDLLRRIKGITDNGRGVACMDCDDGRCPDPVSSQVNVTLPDGSVVKAWEPYCDDLVLQDQQIAV